MIVGQGRFGLIHAVDSNIAMSYKARLIAEEMHILQGSSSMARPVARPFQHCASVVELVYTADLKSAGVSLAGSSPATRTIFWKGAFEAPFLSHANPPFFGAKATTSC